MAKNRKVCLTPVEEQLLKNICSNWDANSVESMSIHSLGCATQEVEIFVKGEREGYTENVLDYLRSVLFTKLQNYCLENTEWNAPAYVEITRVFVVLNDGFDKYLLFCIGRQEDDNGSYCFGNGYHPEEGRWDHGHYNYESQQEAFDSMVDFLTERCQSKAKAVVLYELSGIMNLFVKKEGE